jgi:DNA-binding transcriptional MerR regulator
MGVHPNTVRFYEEAGLITPPERRENGYRVFTELHLRQLELVRLALRAEVLQNGLRKKAIDVVRFCAALDFDRAIASAADYEAMLKREVQNAKAAIKTVEAALHENKAQGSLSLKRPDAANQMNVTVATLRNWERNGLISVRRHHNGCRMYNAADLERLNIIRTLRCANYSLTAILRLVTRLDTEQRVPVEEALNTPADHEDIVSVCDRLLVSLEKTLGDAAQMRALLELMRQNYKTLQ